MKTKIHNFIKSEKLFSKTKKILVAVSGGADSVVLLDLLVGSGYNCGIAHCNFQLRGDESEKDEELVKKLAQKYDLPFFVTRFETEKIAEKNGVSIEMAARDLRYNWFDEIRKKNSYNFIATAHHKNDSVETFLMNIARGTGIRGLTGIPLKNNYIVRPLMFANKNDILKYAENKNIEFRLDRTNLQSVYSRNKVRNRIIPIFEELNPAFQQNIYQNIDRFKEIQHIYDAEIYRKKVICVEETEHGAIIDLNNLKNISPIRTYLFEFLRPYNFSNQIIDDIILSINGISGKQFISSTHRLIKDRNKFIISKINNKLNNKEHKIENYKTNIFIEEGQTDELKLIIKKEIFSKNLKINRNKNYAYLDFDKIKFPLILRKWKNGDYFYPFGMKKKKKLSNFFIDQKLNLIEKENTWLLISDNQIIWVVEHRIDNCFCLTSETKNVLIIEAKNK